MAKRRKVGNLLALAVLSAVVTRPMHPYEIASVLRERDKDRDMPIKWGSLYRVVQNLEKHGFLEPVQRERQGGRPERTVYRITAAGRAEMEDWARELLGVPERDELRFKAGLSVAGALSPDEVMGLLAERVRGLDAETAARRAELARHAGQIPRIFLLESEYELAIRTAEAEWARGLLREMTGGSLPGMDEWRRYHRTGELSEDFQELAERGTDPD